MFKIKSCIGFPIFFHPVYVSFHYLPCHHVDNPLEKGLEPLLLTTSYLHSKIQPIRSANKWK